MSGDPACWLSTTCLACGRVLDDDRDDCSRCGWPLHDQDQPAPDAMEGTSVDKTG